MTSYRKELWFKTPHRRDFLNITPQVETCLKESGIRRGRPFLGRKVVQKAVQHTVALRRTECHSAIGAKPAGAGPGR